MAKASSRKSSTPAATTRSQKNVTTLLDLNAGGNAVALLKTDHRKVEELFKKCEGTQDADEKKSIVEQICHELIVHTLLEEEIFYPACRQQAADKDVLDEAQVEHDGAKTLICELLTQEPSSEFYDAKIKVLQEYIKHHVGEEEKPETGIFALAEKAKLDMSALGQKIRARKTALLEQIEQDRMDLPRPRSLHIKFNLNQGNGEESDMNRQGNYRDRDDQGRFVSDDDRSQSRGGRYGSGRDDDRGYGRQSTGRYRDDYGDDRGYGSQSSGRYRDDSDDDRGGRQGRGSQGGRQGSGWYGDSEGHSQAARSRTDTRYGSRGGGQDYDDDRSQGGWFGDSEGHSEASRRGWQSRGDNDDDGRYSQRGRGGGGRGGRDDDDGGDGRGWYGDSEGHSEASRRGWESRSDNDRGGGRGRGGGGGNGGRSGGSGGNSGGGSRGRSHGGWFGDPEGHSAASRRGWEDRD